MTKVLGEEILKDFHTYFKDDDALVKDALIELQRPREKLKEYLSEISTIVKTLADQ